MTARIAWMLARAGGGSRSATVLPIVAFAVVTTLLLVVAGGVQVFWSWTDELAGLYQVLSVIALVLLAVPLVSLGGSAARLSARRRDDRLSTLRLLGATPAMVSRMTVLESTVLALTGAVIGVIGYLAVAPLVGLIPFRGEPLGFLSLLLPVWLIAAVVVGVAVIAATSALIGLRQVVISPLGVRTRQNAPTLHWLRVVFGLVVVVIAASVGQVLQLAGGIIVMAIILGVAFGGTMAILGLVGPFVLRLMAKRQARRAATPQRLLAARSVLDSPKAAWRQVSGVAMTSFMAVFAGSGMALASAASSSSPDPESAMLITDIGTGLIITLVISFLMVACSVGVNQAADVYDRGEFYGNLAILGMPRAMLDGARDRSVMWPLAVVTIGSALVAGVLVFPLLGMSIVLAPLSILTIVASIAVGVGLVWLGTRVTRPVLTAYLAA